VIGLAHAFLAAGARSTLVTLWPVTDRSTATFMTEFYRELHQGHPAAEALRRIRERWLAGQSGAGHPARWSAFVLVGGPT
jgi:CHAT domain-containing protein